MKGKTPTTEELLERRKEQAFVVMEREKPCTREIISEQAFITRRRVLGISIITAGILLGSGLIVAAFFIPKSHFVWVLVCLLSGCAVGIALVAAVTNGKIHEWIADFGMPRFMTAQEAGKVAAWAEKYPRVKQACIKRGSINPSGTLTSVDYANIQLACSEVELIEERLRKLQKDREQAQAMLNKYGLSDLIKSAAEHRVLDETTPEASEEANIRRI